MVKEAGAGVGHKTGVVVFSKFWAAGKISHVVAVVSIFRILLAR